jgi:hypothetical protein
LYVAASDPETTAEPESPETSIPHGEQQQANPAATAVMSHVLVPYNSDQEGPFAGPLDSIWMTRGGTISSSRADETQSSDQAATNQQPGISGSCADSLPFNIIMQLCSMASLGRDEDTSCPISMEEFDKAFVPSICNWPEECSFVEGRPDICIGVLPCGHKFHAVSLIYHMATNGMRCPVCRCVSPPEHCIIGHAQLEKYCEFEVGTHAKVFPMHV